MATFADLQKRILPKTLTVNAKAVLGGDEILVADFRGALSPATMVDQKLKAALSMRGRRERVVAASRN